VSGSANAPLSATSTRRRDLHSLEPTSCEDASGGYSLSIQSGYVRLPFRIYFTVVLVLIGFLGGMCLARLARRSVARGIPRPLTLMTRWLSNMSLLHEIVGVWMQPGGFWLGTSMILCTILELLSDLAVSGRVQIVNVGGGCPFGTGFAISATYSPTGWWTVPSQNRAPCFVSNARAANGGLCRSVLEGESRYPISSR